MNLTNPDADFWFNAGVPRKSQFILFILIKNGAAEYHILISLRFHYQLWKRSTRLVSFVSAQFVPSLVVRLSVIQANVAGQSKLEIMKQVLTHFKRIRFPGLT